MDPSTEARGVDMATSAIRSTFRRRERQIILQRQDNLSGDRLQDEKKKNIFMIANNGTGSNRYSSNLSIPTKCRKSHITNPIAPFKSNTSKFDVLDLKMAQKEHRSTHHNKANLCKKPRRAGVCVVHRRQRQRTNQSSVGCLLPKAGDAITVSWIHKQHDVVAHVKGGKEQDVKTVK